MNYSKLSYKMDKLNQNAREKKEIKLDNIDVTPILAALIVGFIAVGKSESTPRR